MTAQYGSIAEELSTAGTIAIFFGAMVPEVPLLHRSRRLAPDESGVALEVTPEQAGWPLIAFAVRQLAAGARLTVETADREACLVLLSGHCRVRWNGGESHDLGPRDNVFSGYPHAVYLPAHTRVDVAAVTRTELADCRAPSSASTVPRLIPPAACGFEIRGGGNATRQIVDILPPSFPADRLMICEVFTPSGNWSSYPPHKHDVDNPPSEADLDEIYYFRMRDSCGYAFQRLYSSDGSRDQTFTVTDGDLLLIHEGYHPFVTAYGYDAYYLNVLAGSRRSMAASDDPRYARLRAAWPPPDPRVPLIERPTR
jgi:5-deoxy-glucuronate isomerase